MMKKTKKSNAKRKFAAAAAMLLISALVLSSATYAWFTMSKEVEVTGIHLTASVPASIQISLGEKTNATTGGLTMTIDEGTSGTDRLTAVAAPSDDEHWTNSVELQEYYTFGKLTPATSINGLNIYYTPDVTGVGKTLKGQRVGNDGVMMDGSGTEAVFSQADATDALSKNNLTTDVLKVTDRTADTDALTNYANGGAYYIDIPVWFRTSISDADPQLAVKATFIQGTNDYTKSGSTNKADQIYKAARVSILKGNNASTAENDVQGVICDSGTNYYRTANGAKNSALASAYTVDGTGEAVNANWKAVNFITQWSTSSGDYASNGDAVVKISKASANTTWGEATPYTIRVWLEGEDVNCWNATAGQDFYIDLSFKMKATS